MSGVKVPDPLQPHVRPVLQLDRVRVRPEMPSHVSPANRLTRPSAFCGLVHLVEVTRDHQAAGLHVLGPRTVAGLPVDADVTGQDRPDLLGSITKHTVSGPMNTQSHHFAGPSPSRGGEHPPRRLVRVQVPGAPRPLRDRVRQRDEQRPGLRARPRQSSRGDLRAVDRPVTSEFMLRPATNRSVSSIAMNPLEKRPLPIAFGGPGAVTGRDPAGAGPPVPAPRSPCRHPGR